MAKLVSFGLNGERFVLFIEWKQTLRFFACLTPWVNLIICGLNLIFIPSFKIWFVINNSNIVNQNLTYVVHPVTFSNTKLYPLILYFNLAYFNLNQPCIVSGFQCRNKIEHNYNSIHFQRWLNSSMQTHSLSSAYWRLRYEVLLCPQSKRCEFGGNEKVCAETWMNFRLIVSLSCSSRKLHQERETLKRWY